jgi:predicted transglutaminase-like cysteine proteinase
LRALRPAPRLARLAVPALLLALALGGGAPAVQAAASAYPALFGTQEARSDNIALFPKWQGALERYFDESSEPSGVSRQDLAIWQRFLDGLEDRGPMAQIEAVNAEMNRQRYIQDPPNWGVPDYWATPLQFFEKNGDCEDYAIAKFMSLRALGWPNDAMRIVVLKDMNLQLMHAVLVVYHGGRAYVLDNQIDQVMQADRIRHYRPIYSVNETSWWLHRS